VAGRIKVLIVGSTERPSDKSFDPVLDATFISACEEIGEELARANFELVIGSYRERTADLHVLQGYARVDGARTVWFLRPVGEILTPKPDLPPWVEVKDKVVRGPWPAGRVPQILEADAVLLLRGRNHTQICGYVAPSLEKPVLAIGALGGAAHELWEGFEPYYQRLGSLRNEMGALCRSPWEPGAGRLVPQVINCLLSRRVFQHQRIWPSIVGSVVTLSLVACWVALFRGWLGTDSLPLFLMMLLGGLGGVVLRINQRLIAEPTIRFSWPSVAADLQNGVILGFVMVLLYLIGVVTITGEAHPIPEPSTAGDFQRIAVVTTLLALGAGFSPRQAAARLRGWFADAGGVQTQNASPRNGSPR
jgi:hypothetical protein